ncbi:DUF3152 domain-containing protein [Nocardioides plantarum]|uniref:DUF3152 domain-containing protein n=1 Tax=Nocardioides plantarum TaxID=29299 RepID=A0ABV5K9M0_9ACTN|nr:DUF3152 domain-containing protein [Nocardioides plantarum]
MWKPRGLVVAVLASALLALVVPSTSAEPARAGEVVSTLEPTVRGEPVWGRTLSTSGGAWEPARVTKTYRWLRDGQAISGATASTYRLGTRDLGHRLSVRVTATEAEGNTATATSPERARVVRAALVNRERPQVAGTPRYGRVLAARVGRWWPQPERFTYRWFRGPDPIANARSARYALAPADVGRRISVQVTGSSTGRRTTAARSPSVLAKHVVDVRRSVTYSVRTDGRITADLTEFKRLVQETYEDPRGWRASGVSFRRVSSGGSFTVVLAEASRLPSYDSICSTTWSCRAGRFVVINQTRWLHASPAWNKARRSLRDYRHMVVNHETGHWLGNGHASCPRAGALAPVMMQQSKGTQGCTFNPWPTAAELR